MQMIAENDRGYVALDGNELIVGSKMVDPPKVRMTSPTDQFGGGGGVLSANISRHAGIAVDGHQQIEIGFLRFEQSEAVRGQPGNPRGEYNVLQPKEAGLPIEMVYPTEGCPVVVGPNGIFRNAPNPNAARLFQCYCFTIECQQLVVDFGKLRSMHPLVRETDGRRPFASIMTMKEDAAAVEKMGEEIKARYSKLFGV